MSSTSSTATARALPGEIYCGSRHVPLDLVYERAARAASGLASTGVREGSAVGLLLRNDITFIEALLAVSFLGAYAIPLNWHYKSEEIGQIVEDSRATHLVGHADLLRGLDEELVSRLVVVGVSTPPEIVEAYGLDAQDAVLPRGVPDWHIWPEDQTPWPPVRRRHGGTMFYTSGTTGRPKGVKRQPLGDAQRRRFARLGEEWFGNRVGMRAAVAGPLYHSGQVSYASAAMRSRGSVFILPRFDPQELLRLISEQRLTHLHLVPIMMSRLVALPPEVRGLYDTSSLEFVVHGAAPCPPEVKRALIEWWGPVVHEYYATTEAGMVTRASSEEWLARPGTVGRPWPGRIVRIYDEGGRELPPYAEGDVYMSLDLVPDFTYENAPGEREAVERDGLVTSGDIGFLDGDGFLYLCDRKRDMLISGGVNIYPAEIEAVLASHPDVADCAVFGIPDDEFGESVAAIVELRPTAATSAEDLRAFVSKRLAAFKAPRVVAFVEALPRDDSGKISKRALREPYWAGTGRRI